MHVRHKYFDDSADIQIRGVIYVDRNAKTVYVKTFFNIMDWHREIIRKIYFHHIGFVPN